MASRTTSRQGATASRRTGEKPRASASRSSARPKNAKRPPAGASRGAKKSPPRLGWLAPVSIAVLVIIAAWSFYPVARMQYREEREKQRLEAELSSLKERNSKLRAEVDRLKTPEGVEEVARENLGLVKEGENLYVVLDGEQTDATTTAAPDTAPTTADIAGMQAPSWQRVLDMVFGFE